MQIITVISEYLDSLVTLPPRPLPNEICKGWQGIEKKMKLDLTIAEPKITTWTPLKKLPENCTIFNLNDGLSVTCPTKLEGEKDFIIAVDWLFDRDLLYREIAEYQSGNFSSLSLESFSSQKN